MSKTNKLIILLIVLSLGYDPCYAQDQSFSEESCTEFVDSHLRPVKKWKKHCYRRIIPCNSMGAELLYSIKGSMFSSCKTACDTISLLNGEYSMRRPILKALHREMYLEGRLMEIHVVNGDMIEYYDMRHLYDSEPYYHALIKTNKGEPIANECYGLTKDGRIRLLECPSK